MQTINSQQGKSLTGQAVIIAAGESSRFWPLANGIHKTQMFLLGKPIIYWTLKGLKDAGIDKVVVVHAKNSSLPEMLQEENDLGITLSFAVQEKPLGTGNALWQAREFIKEPFFAVWPNKVNAGEIAKQMLSQRERDQAQAVLVGAETQSPWDYGVARIEGERVVEIVENPEKGKEPSNLKIIGFYFFEPDFFSYYEKLPKHHEADFIETANLYLKDKKASLVTLEQDVPALKYPWELLDLMAFLFRSQGADKSIASSATIGEGTVIEGPVYVGENCRIGPHNMLRGPLNLEKGTITGAFMELKHSVAQEGVHFHSGYLGDSVVGKNCRFGAGFVAANRRLDRNNIFCRVRGEKVDTGRAWLGAVVGEGTSFGIHTGTMPGVFVGSQSVIGPGVMVFENVPDNARISQRPQTKISSP